MKQITKQTKLFTLIGIFGTIIGYVFLLYKGYTLNNEIRDKKNEINGLEMLRVEKVKQLTDLENKLLQITSTSKDSNTVAQGKKLSMELGIPTGNYFKVTSAEETNLENARKFEELGYESLLKKDLDNSIDAFIKSENSNNGYHQVYEIARYLIKNKAKLSDKDSDYWKVAYQTIISQYGWRMPENYKIKFQEQVK